jgi:hypothetical protein
MQQGATLASPRALVAAWSAALPAALPLSLPCYTSPAINQPLNESWMPHNPE